VLQALRLAGLSSGLENQVLFQIGTESGGRPDAINLTDINAQMGHPSKGLLQVIDPTFNAFAGGLRGLGIWNPLANIFAAIEYARAVYGPTLMSGGSGLGSGHGYALGTAAAAPGWAWVGERGPELMRFRGGEQVIPAPGGRGGGGQPVKIVLQVKGGGQSVFDQLMMAWLKEQVVSAGGGSVQAAFGT